jgi:glycerol-3-phosphate cytidylyltransferase
MITGITASTFDLLHAGHIEMLREAKTHCEYLICALQIDPSVDRPEKNKPVQSIVERYTQLEAVRFVDEIIPYLHESDLEDILEMRQINVRILGEEYREKDFTGRDICKARNIQLHFNKRDHRFSSSGLRKRVQEANNGNVARNSGMAERPTAKRSHDDNNS